MTTVDTLRERDRRDLSDAPDRPVPSLDVTDPEWPDDAPEFHQLVTAGVRSDVIDTDGETVGHVVMLDYDDVDPADALADARDLAGPTLLLRSSPGSYHVVDLAVRPWSDALDAGRSSAACSTFVDGMADRGHYSLRTLRKLRKTGERYRDAPEPVALLPGDAGPLSVPHLTHYRQLAEDRAPDLADALDADGETVGRTLISFETETLTDEIREVWNDG